MTSVLQFVAQDKHGFVLCTRLDSTGNTRFAVFSNFLYLVEKSYAFVLVSNTDPSGETNPNKFLLHPLLSAEPDLNPATNGA